MESLNIFFCVNQTMIQGLGSTLVSLIRHCSDSSRLKLWFIISDFSEKDIDNVAQLLDSENYQGDTEFLEIDVKNKFKDLTSFYGDRMIYGRLLISDILDSGYALYLDSDLVIKLDILGFLNFQTNKVIAAVERKKIKNAFDTELLINKLNLNPEAGYFNSGVLLINISAWKQQNISQEIAELCKKVGLKSLTTPDQTLLNAVAKGDFTRLPAKFNLGYFPTKLETGSFEDSIIHFNGSPKPWDFFGKFFHYGYEHWKEFQTPFWENEYQKVTGYKLRRTIKIGKFYWIRFLEKYNLRQKTDGIERND